MERINLKERDDYKENLGRFRIRDIYLFAKKRSWKKLSSKRKIQKEKRRMQKEKLWPNKSMIVTLRCLGEV